MSKEESQLLRWAKTGIGAGLLAKDTIMAAVKDVLDESDLSEERKSKLEEKLIQRTETELGNLENTLQEGLKEGRNQAGLASKEEVQELEKRVSQIEDQLAEFEEDSNST